MSNQEIQERLYISKGTIIGFIIFGITVTGYIIETILDMKLFTDRESTAILGIAIILLLLGFIIDQLSFRGFRFWAFGAILSFFGVFIFFSPILLYGLNNNDSFLWLLLVCVGFFLILFGYTVDAYELNNKLAKVLINFWDAIIRFQWKQIPKRLFQLLSVFFIGVFSYIMRGIREFRTISTRFAKKGYHFCKTSIEKSFDLLIEIPNIVFKTLKSLYSQSFWLLIPSILLLFLFMTTDVVSSLGFIPLYINILVLFIIAVSQSNQERLARFTKVVINTSWSAVQSVSTTVQIAKERLGRYKCVTCNAPLKLGQEKCSNCSTEIKRCAICKLPIKSEQQITTCKGCHYPSHSNHWDQWIRMGRSCPICHTD